jgi:mannose-6-phosphate isomerase class I
MEISNKYLDNRLPNYDKTPFVEIGGNDDKAFSGWASILDELNRRLSTLDRSKQVIVVDYYPGVNEAELFDQLIKPLCPTATINTNDLFISEDKIRALTQPDVTGDEVFGFITRLRMPDFFDSEKLSNAQRQVNNSNSLVIVYGCGASLVTSTPDVLIYADMPRWELQLRYRRNEINNLGINNKEEKASLQYKRGFFVDWRVADKHKRNLMEQWDYILDTTKSLLPKMVEGDAYRIALALAAKRPYRVVPSFDPGPWGGQWMKEVCDLNRNEINFAWCFDCVPEENSMLLKFGDILFETPAINHVFNQSKQLLGEPVQARFGDEFPIRFDFLDTMGGGNLSLQVHPTTEYIRENFGMHYTQDESYYLLEADDDACVYLGFNETIDPALMIDELTTANKTGASFNVEKHVTKWPVKKHDHVLIPAGTIHCSGANSMVLEISATPYIFTFKLWDWQRLGLDGKPRPINIEHGKKVLNWDRKKEWTKANLVNVIETIATGDGWKEERTGLHKSQFIETRRHWFSKPVIHYTNDSINVLNLIEGREAIVESPTHAFDPFVVHYAETFIVPAAVGQYSIRPFGESEGCTIGTIKAFVRH